MEKKAPDLAKDMDKASFRGVPFQIDDSDISAGRRVRVHEYPQRDKPYVEDLGRATREIRITGFVIGEKYVKLASNLLGALEEAGPGALQHPWLGNLRVTLKDLGKVRYTKALGMATIEMVFVEAGELEFPTSKDSTQAAAALAAAKLGDKASDDFASKFTVNGAMDYVIAAGKGDILRIFQLSGNSSIPGIGYLDFASKVADATQSALILINDPSALGRNILGAFGVFSLVAQGKRIADLLRGSVSASSSFVAPASGSATGVSASEQQLANTAALYNLCRRSLLVQAVGLSSQLPTVVHDDAIAIRNLLVNALDKESLTAPDGVYQALQDARTACWRDLTERANGGARLTTLTPPETMPMLAIAYDYYGDATRADEVIERNNVRHPLFVPALPIKVISS